jgi:hypothetical protein
MERKCKAYNTKKKQLQPLDKVILRLLFDWGRGVGGAIGRCVARATTLRCWSGHFGIFAIIIVVFVNVHVARSRFVLLRPFLLRCFRHPRRWRRHSHCRKRRRVVSRFGRMVAIVESSSVWSTVRAVTSNLWRGRWMGRSRPAAVWLLKLLALFLIRRWLRVDMIVIFPLAVPFGRCSWRTIIPLACSGFGSSQSRCWRRRTTRNAAAGRVIGMVLVWSLITVARGAWAMFDNWSNLRWRTGWTPVWERWPLGRALR